jgi:hypothetical protein
MEASQKTLAEVLKEIEEKRYQFQFEVDVPESLKGNLEVIGCHLKHGNFKFKQLPEEARNNREILLLIAKENGIREFPDWAKDDEEILITALKQNGDAFEHAPERLRSKREVVMAALSTGYNNLEHVAAEELRNDKEILKLAVANHSQALKWVPERWRGDKELLDIILTTKMCACDCFELFPAEYRDDKKIALKAVQDDRWCFKHLSDRLRDDNEVVALALEGDESLLEYASPRIRDDKDIVMSVIKSGKSWVFRYISERLKADKDLAVAAMERDSRAFDQLNPALQKDPDVIKACLRDREYFDGECYRHFDESFRANREIALKLSTGKNFPLKAATEIFQSDKKIVRNAVESEASNFNHIGAALLEDMSFMRELHSINYEVLKYMDEAVKQKLFSTRVESVEHRGRRIIYEMALDNGYVEDEQRPVRKATVQAGQGTIFSMGAFPVITYEKDGPVGSYLNVRFVNNLQLAGDFVFFLKLNSGQETSTKQLDNGGWGPPPQPNDDFLKHEVYLVPDGSVEMSYQNLSFFPRIYWGRKANLPRGIQLFPSEESYREAFSVLTQEEVYGTPQFTRIDDSTLRAVETEVDEVFGAARVYVDDHGWRFLIPHAEGALKSLAVLKATTDADDWEWIKSRLSAELDARLKELLATHFAGAPFAADVAKHCGS